jgi:hypothetical protein
MAVAHIIATVGIQTGGRYVAFPQVRSAVSLLGLVVLADSSPAVSSPLSPQGIYATVDISDYLANHSAAEPDTLYDDMLGNHAIKGIALKVHWDQAQPKRPSADLHLADVTSAFDKAAAKGKTIQLIVTPGINSPKWLWDDPKKVPFIPSCDWLFNPNLQPNSGCGTVIFSCYSEGNGNCTSLVLPLPWNATYTKYWHEFLTALQEKYNLNPLYKSTLVSVTIAGPTALTPEMILPNNFNTCPPNVAGPCQSQQNNTEYAEDVWNTLFPKPSPDPSHTDQLGRSVHPAET